MCIFHNVTFLHKCVRREITCFKYLTCIKSVWIFTTVLGLVYISPFIDERSCFTDSRQFRNDILNIIRILILNLVFRIIIKSGIRNDVSKSIILIFIETLFQFLFHQRIFTIDGMNCIKIKIPDREHTQHAKFRIKPVDNLNKFSF